MPNEHDDLEAIRTIVDTLTPFEKAEQKRIVRWAFEKLGIDLGEVAPTNDSGTAAHTPSPVPAPTPTPAELPSPDKTRLTDIKSFISTKKPANDMQFVATVAYFYAFEVPEESRKDEVDSDDIQDACRLAGRERLANPGQTMRNAAYNGLLDKGSEKGAYKINTVGENLVALTLPAGDAADSARKPTKRVSRAESKKPGKTRAKKNAKKAVGKTKAAKKKAGKKLRKKK